MPTRRSTLAARVVVLAALAPVLAPALHAQTIGGQIVDLRSGRPIGRASVALVDDSARVVATVVADSATGGFYVDAPRAGQYRVVIFTAGASFVSPALQLDSAGTLERQFSVPEVPGGLRGALFAQDVTTPATLLPGSPAPHYPDVLLQRGIRGLVSTMFVVREDGHPDPRTFQTLMDAEPGFVEVVRASLARARFTPAMKGDSAVAQVVQLTYDFGLAGDPPRGDIVVRPPDTSSVATSAPAPGRRTGHDRYVITREELDAPAIRDQMLATALKTLRPSMYGRFDATPQMTADGGAVEIRVNDQTMNSYDVLRTIRAGDVEEVRLWRVEEAKVRFGMGRSAGVLTIRLRPGK